MLGRPVQNTIVALKFNSKEIYGRDVAEHLTGCFVSVVTELTAGLPSVPFRNHSTRPIAESFHFQPADADKIETIFKKVNSKKYHKDEIQPFIPNLVVPKIAHVLACYFGWLGFIV